jgi:DNA-directed RNA polymerase specialized sigma54-like protein
MDKDAADPIVSEHELRILIKALAKSVEYIHRRHLILTFIAGLLIGIGAGVLIVNFASISQRNFPEAEILLRKSDDALKELQQIRSMLNSLSAAKKDSTDGMTAVDEKVSVLPQKKAESVQEKAADLSQKKMEAVQQKVSDLPQKKTETAQDIRGAVTPSIINKIHIHYARQKDKKKAKAFADFLRKKGYASVDIERIQNKCRDIRYFHEEDRKAALLLQKQFNDFVAHSHAAKGIKLKVKNLGKSYPQAQRGSLEVWLFF